MPRCDTCEFYLDGAIETSCGTEYDPYCSAGVPEEDRVMMPVRLGAELGCRHHYATLKKWKEQRDKEEQEYYAQMAEYYQEYYSKEEDDHEKG